MFSDSEYDRMFLEEMNRQVAVREGEKVERTTIERAALRAIGLKAAKGDAKAYKALADKRAAIDKRRQAVWEIVLEAVLDYQKWATGQLKLHKRIGKTGPEIIPHSDDIEIDFKHQTIIFNGPITADQKMAQDFLVANRSEFSFELFDKSPTTETNRRLYRQLRKARMQMEEVLRLVATRASKIDSWEVATLEERTDFLRKEVWPTLSKNIPLPLVQSELCFKSACRSYLGVELTDEEEEQLIVELRKAFQVEVAHNDVKCPSDGFSLP